ncbi:putative uncharacterized protein [Tetragenococcus halophilus subsp. halophilus]|uniref:DUF2922 domain-containing protein n=1 Tax=Tetragenococcus halophilus TaxID=51669 RepID=UPI000CA8EAFF|nr:DUF2922 domain-containing protein [Tetragenococcus halophilus]MCO8285318.1 DUF2922 domain-containing protein [Tetragenococcus halophilus]GBD66979.1 putative uncharacterized protein [Tetragenococcus halophilus subsp. halophilus]GBD78895.1 putative uncharacterized protein [Tetragenococcus halophilus subsp. halophilus]
MKKLYLTFLNEEGKKHNLIPKVAAEDLTEAEVRQSMEQLRDLDIFDKQGVRLYQDIDSAKYVETIETPLF